MTKSKAMLIALIAATSVSSGNAISADRAQSMFLNQSETTIPAAVDAPQVFVLSDRPTPPQHPSNLPITLGLCLSNRPAGQTLSDCIAGNDLSGGP